MKPSPVLWTRPATCRLATASSTTAELPISRASSSCVHGRWFSSSIRRSGTVPRQARRRRLGAHPRRGAQLSPKRSGSITVVCSTSTRVTAPSRVMEGRKLAGWALAEAWRDEHCAQAKEFIPLDDHCVSGATLLSPTCPPWRGKAKDVARHHVRRRIRATAPPSACGWPASLHDRHRRPPAVRPWRRSRSESGAWRPPLVGPCGRPRNHSARRC